MLLPAVSCKLYFPMARVVTDSSALILLARCTLLEIACEIFEISAPSAVRKGFEIDKQDRLLEKYVRGELSQLEVCSQMNWDPWEFSDQLKARNMHLNVDLGDWLDASELG